MNWHHITTQLPPKTGNYLCATCVMKREKPHIFINHYIKGKGFDFDLLMQDRGKKQRIYAWATIPPAPMMK